MIWRPKSGQRVVLRYREELRRQCPHLENGVVVTAGGGPGPLNALVKLYDGRRFIVPRGNLFYEGD